MKPKVVFLVLVMMFCGVDKILCAETKTERAIVNSIRQFGSSEVPAEYANLWLNGSRNSTDSWRSIKSSGTRYNMDWRLFRYFKSEQAAINRSGNAYNAGILVIDTGNSDYCAWVIYYLTDSSGRLINIRDNVSRDLDVPMSKARESLNELIDRWIQ